MKQLVIAAAVSLTLATMPAIASSVFDPVTANKWSSSCPTDVKHIYIPKGHLYVVIAVQSAHSGPPVAIPTVGGGDPATICCNGKTYIVAPGNFQYCKADQTITIADKYPGSGPDCGTRGYWYHVG